MIKTGKYKINPITQEEVEIVILQESDFNFLKEWEQLPGMKKLIFYHSWKLNF